MDDKTLLELAAKAAGSPVVIGRNHSDQPDIWRIDEAGDRIEWNPLTDDGDALRLAVKLNLHIGIDCESAGCVVIQWGFDASGESAGSIVQEAPITGDDYAATRRAIVRAAAEIGKSMQAAPAAGNN